MHCEQIFLSDVDSADIIASQGVTEGREYASVVSYQDIDTSNPESPVHTTETHNQASLQQRFPNQVNQSSLRNIILVYTIKTVKIIHVLMHYNIKTIIQCSLYGLAIVLHQEACRV